MQVSSWCSSGAALPGWPATTGVAPGLRQTHLSVCGCAEGGLALQPLGKEDGKATVDAETLLANGSALLRGVLAKAEVMDHSERNALLAQGTAVSCAPVQAPSLSGTHGPRRSTIVLVQGTAVCCTPVRPLSPAPVAVQLRLCTALARVATSERLRAGMFGMVATVAAVWGTAGRGRSR